MRGFSRTARLVAIVAMGTILIGAGGCIGDNFWAGMADEVAAGLILGAINLALTPTGIQI